MSNKNNKPLLYLSGSDNIVPRRRLTEDEGIPLGELVTSSRFNPVETNSRFNVSDYSDYLGHSVYENNPLLNVDRANAQSTSEQLYRASLNLLPNIFLGATEIAGYLGELPGVITGIDRDFDNALIRFAQKYRNPAGEVYVGSNEHFSNESGWWINTSFGLLESIMEFYIGGMGVGSLAKGVTKGLSKAYIKQQALNIGKNFVPKLLNKSGQLATASTLAYTESAMSATRVYKETYDNFIKFNQYKYKGDELIKKAKEFASEAASKTVAYNTFWNTLLNFTSVAPIFKNNSSTIKSINSQLKGKSLGKTLDEVAENLNNLSYIPTKRSALKMLAGEAVQEGTEEVVNAYAELEGRIKGDLTPNIYGNGVDKFFSTAFSGEGGLNFILGAIGGVGQTAVMNYVPYSKTPEINPDTGEIMIDEKTKKPIYKRVSLDKKNQLEEVANAKKYVKDIKKDVEDLFIKVDNYKKSLAEGDKVGIEISKIDLINMNNLSSISRGSSYILSQVYDDILDIDNKVDLGEELTKSLDEIRAEIEKINSLIKEEKNPENLKQLRTNLEELKKNESEIIKEIKSVTGKTQAMKLGFAESKEDNDYITLAKEAKQALIEAEEDYKKLGDIYNIYDLATRNYADSVFRLEQKIKSNNRALNKIEELSKVLDGEIKESFDELASNLKFESEEYQSRLNASLSTFSRGVAAKQYIAALLNIKLSDNKNFLQSVKDKSLTEKELKDNLKNIVAIFPNFGDFIDSDSTVKDAFEILENFVKDLEEKEKESTTLLDGLREELIRKIEENEKELNNFKKELSNYSPKIIEETERIIFEGKTLLKKLNELDNLYKNSNPKELVESLMGYHQVASKRLSILNEKEVATKKLEKLKSYKGRKKYVKKFNQTIEALKKEEKESKKLQDNIDKHNAKSDIKSKDPITGDPVTDGNGKNKTNVSDPNTSGKEDIYSESNDTITNVRVSKDGEYSRLSESESGDSFSLSLKNDVNNLVQSIKEVQGDNTDEKHAFKDLNKENYKEQVKESGLEQESPATDNVSDKIKKDKELSDKTYKLIEKVSKRLEELAPEKQNDFKYHIAYLLSNGVSISDISTIYPYYISVIGRITNSNISVSLLELFQDESFSKFIVDEVVETVNDFIKDYEESSKPLNYLVDFTPATSVANLSNPYKETEITNADGDLIKTIVSFTNEFEEHYNTNILKPGFIVEGETELEFVPVTFENLYEFPDKVQEQFNKVRNETKNDNEPNFIKRVPIAIYKKGTKEIVGYLHTSDFIIKNSNIAKSNKFDLEKQLQYSEFIRKKALDSFSNNINFVVTVSEFNSGFKSYNHEDVEGKNNSLTLPNGEVVYYQNTQNAVNLKDIEVLVAKNGVLVDSNNNIVTDIQGYNPDLIVNGATYMLVPAPNGEKLLTRLPQKRVINSGKNGKFIIKSIINAIRLHYQDKAPTIEITEGVKLDLNTYDGIVKYINSLIYVNFADTIDSIYTLTAKSNNSTPNSGFINVSKKTNENGQQKLALVFAKGKGTARFIDHNTDPKQFMAVLSRFMEVLSLVPTNVDHSLAEGGNVKINKILNDGTVETETKSFKDYATMNNSTIIHGKIINKETGERAYVEQPKISFSLSSELQEEFDREYNYTKEDSVEEKSQTTDDSEIISILNSDKAKQVFENTETTLEEKLDELQIPEEQKQIILDKRLENNKPNVILPIGTSGSGKSTFIKTLPQENLVVIEPDTMRVEFTGNINDKSKDKEIYEEAAKRAIVAIKQGKQVVFDTTNLTKEKRLPFINAIKKAIPTATIQYKLMELNPELAKQRIKAQLARGENRANVSDATIDRHAESYKQMLEDIKNEPISEFTDNLRKKIITSLLSDNSTTSDESNEKLELLDSDSTPFDNITLLSIDGLDNHAISQNENEGKITLTFKNISNNEIDFQITRDSNKDFSKNDIMKYKRFLSKNKTGKKSITQIQKEIDNNFNQTYESPNVESDNKDVLTSEESDGLKENFDNFLEDNFSNEEVNQLISQLFVDESIFSVSQQKEFIRFYVGKIAEIIDSKRKSSGSASIKVSELYSILYKTIEEKRDEIDESNIDLLDEIDEIIDTIETSEDQDKVEEAIQKRDKIIQDSENLDIYITNINNVLNEENSNKNFKKFFYLSFMEYNSLMDAGFDLTLSENESEEFNDIETNLEENYEGLLERTLFEDDSIWSVDFKDTISKSLKGFLLKIHSTKRNSLGFPDYQNFDSVANESMRIISSNNVKPNYSDIIELLKNNAKYNNNLTKIIEALESADDIIKTQFVTTMSRHFVDSVSVYERYGDKGESFTPASDHISTASEALFSTWVANFNFSPFVTIQDKVIKDDETGKKAVKNVIDVDLDSLYVEFSNGIKNIEEKLKQNSTYPNLKVDLKNLLNLVGITVSDVFLDTIISGNYINNSGKDQTFKTYFLSKYGVLNSIKTNILSQKRNKNNNIDSNEQDVENNITDAVVYSPFFGSRNKTIKSFARDIVNIDNAFFANSFVAPDGKVIWSYQLDNALIQRFEKITSEEGHKIFINTNSTLRAANTWAKLFNPNNFNSQIFKIIYPQYLKVYGVLQKATHFSKLSPTDREILKLNMFFNRGKKFSNNKRKANFMFPFFSDKKNPLAITAPISNNTVINSNGKIGNDYIATITNQFIQEYKSMLEFNKLNIKGYDGSDGKILLFKNVDFEFLFDKEKNEYREITKEDIPAINKAIENYLKEEIKYTKKKWNELGILNSNQSSSEIGKIDNKYLESIESKLVLNENSKAIDKKIQLQNYAVADYVINYKIAYYNMFDTFIGDPKMYWKKDIATTFENITKRLTKEKSPGLLQRLDTGGKFSQPIKGLVVTTDESNIIDDVIRRQYESYGYNYEGIESTDGLHLISSEQHLINLVNLGRISISKFDELMLKEQNETLNAEDLKFFIAQKPVFSGYRKVTVDGITKEVPTFIKTASFVLPKQFITGNKQLESINELLNKVGGNIFFDSAFKLGAPNNLIKLINRDGTINVNFTQQQLDESSVSFDRSLYKLQQEQPYKTFKDISASQSDKLIFLNGGTEKDFEYNGKKTIQELKELDIKYKSQIYDILEDLLKDELTNENGDVDIKKLQIMLKKEAISRGWSINDIYGLDLISLNDNYGNQKLKFKVPIWLNYSSGKIESLLLSILDARFRKLQYNGTSSILQPDLGFYSPFSNTNKNGFIFTKNFDFETGRLKPQRIDEKTGKVLGAQVLLPFKFSFKGKQLNLKDFSKYDSQLKTYVLDETKFGGDLESMESLLESIGFRIPTQDLSSLNKIEIVGFHNLGDQVIMPASVTKQTGHDFDIDKLNAIFNNVTITNKGKEIIPFDVLTERENISAKTEEKRNKLLKMIEVKRLQNEIFNIKKAIVSNPRIHRQMIQPLDDKGLATFKDEFKSLLDNISEFDLLSPNYWLTKYEQAAVGKIGVGKFSLMSTFNAIIQNTGFDFKLYKIKDKEQNQESSIKSDFEEVNHRVAFLDFDGSVIKQTSLDSEKSFTGKYKSEIFTAFGNESVDNTNKNSLGYLNVNNVTFDTIQYMIQSGFDTEHIIYFINHPIIKHITNLIATKKGSYMSHAIELKNILTEQVKSNNETEQQSSSSTIAGDNIALDFRKIKDQTKSKINDFKELPNDSEEIKEYLQVLERFIRMSTLGKRLGSLQRLFNVDSAGVGKTAENLNIKSQQLGNMFNNYFADSFSDYSIKISKNLIIDISNLVESFFDINKNREVKGKNVSSLSTIRTINLYQELYSDLFIVNTDVYSDLFNILKETTSYDITDSVKDEILSKAITDGMKAYSVSSVNSGVLSQDNINKSRYEILLDYSHLKKESLAFKILNLKNSPKYRKNIFIQSLMVKPDPSGNSPSTIEFNDARGKNKSELDLYLDVLQLYKEDRLTFDKLVEYSVITGNLQKSKQFTKFLLQNKINPKFSEYLRNVDTQLSNYSGIFDSQNGKLQTLAVQIAQHNPVFFVKQNEEELNFLPSDIIKIDKNRPNIIGLPSQFQPKDISTAPKMFSVKSDFGYNLYILQNNQNGYFYNKIPTLKNEYNSDVNYNNGVYYPSLYKNNNKGVNYYTSGYNRFNSIGMTASGDFSSSSLSNFFAITEEGSEISATDMLEVLRINSSFFNNNNSLINSLYDSIIEASKSLPQLTFVQDTNIKSSGSYNNGVIKINPNNIKTPEHFYEVVFEEISHAILVNTINNPNEFAKPFVEGLGVAQKIFREHVLSNDKHKARLMQIESEFKENNKSRFYNREEILLFNGILERSKRLGVQNNSEFSYSQQEFAAMFLASAKFREFLKEVKIDKTTEKSKNLFELVAEYIQKIFNSIGIDFSKDYYTATESIINGILQNTNESLKESQNITNEVIKDFNNTLNNQIDKFSEDEAQESPQVTTILSDNTQYQKSQNLEGEYNDVVSPFEKMTKEEQVAFEKTIRDLSARIADRIGLDYKIDNDKSQKWKGRIVNNKAEINLAYATLDTPIHEILGHPIIRAIKKGNNQSFAEWVFNNNPEFAEKYPFIGAERIVNEKLSKQQKDTLLKQFKKETTGNTQLYQNLLKELEYGKGKEVFDRVKRTYIRKFERGETFTFEGKYYIADNASMTGYRDEYGNNIDSNELETALSSYELKHKDKVYYTLEEQQEEAIVELLGLYTADRLDKVKDGKLISLLKKLLKEVKVFMRNLLNQKEVEIDKLPDNMTLGNIADLLAYSNSKLILPGNEVVYTTPDNETFKTYQEASNHISKLAKLSEVDLNKVALNDKKQVPESLKWEFENQGKTYKEIIENKQWKVYDGTGATQIVGNQIYKGEKGGFYWDGESYLHASNSDNKITKIPFNEFLDIFSKIKQFGTDKLYQDRVVELSKYDLEEIYPIKQFISKNKEYEQSKEIIEEWKKVNDIKYDPEEVYSRGQGFYSSIGAYSDFDVDLMMQNLLTHLEDNKKSGGEFTISAFTKPVDKRLKHIESTSGKIRFKIFPKSEDIKWAANTDVYSGSVWDASEKVSKDTKSEIIGVSYTKSPTLSNIDAVQPNLASIIDNLSHHHNELGIELTSNNFRLEYDEDIPYSTKKILDSINSILDQKYGKLIEPEIQIQDNNKEIYQVIDETDGTVFKTFTDRIDAAEWLDSESEKQGYPIPAVIITKKDIGKQPAQTNENLKESIDSIKKRNTSLTVNVTKQEAYEAKEKGVPEIHGGNTYYKYKGFLYNIYEQEDLGFFADPNNDIYEKIKPKKEYTSQAEINTKVAALKEGARRFPRNLIRSEVRPIGKTNFGFNENESTFQKIEDLTKQNLSSEQNQEGVINNELLQKTQIITNQGKNISELGITLDTWNNLSEEQKNKILICN